MLFYALLSHDTRRRTAKSTICNSSCADFDGSCGAGGVLIHLGRGVDEIRHKTFYVPGINLSAFLCIVERNKRSFAHMQ